MEFNERDEWAMLRRKSKISMEQIAKSIGCTRQHLSYYELGDRNMSKGLVEKYQNYILNHSK